MLSARISEIKLIKSAVAQCTSAINLNDPLQSCLKLETDDDNLVITAVDTRISELKLRCIGAVPLSKGAVLINATTLNTLLGTFDGSSSITLIEDEENKQLVLTVDNTITEIPLFKDPVEDFPVAEKLPETISSINGQLLTNAIKSMLIILAQDKQEFVSFRLDKQLDLYSISKGRMFTRISLPTIGSASNKTNVAIPMGLLSKLPKNLSDQVDICYDIDTNTFCISSETEHLIIKSVVPDTASTHIDKMIKEEADGSCVISTSLLNQDLKRAIYIDDPKGLLITPDSNGLALSCSYPGRASIKNSYHDYLSSTGTINSVRVDPLLLERAMAGLDCSELIIEQIVKEFPALDPDDEPEQFYELRLQDETQPGYIYIICTTLLNSAVNSI